MKKDWRQWKHYQLVVSIASTLLVVVLLILMSKLLHVIFHVRVIEALLAFGVFTVGSLAVRASSPQR